MHDSREERINILVMKQCQKLNRKVDETLAAGWKQWSAQAAELQLLWVDAENHRKDGKAFNKMDKTNITMVREDLTEDFHALINGHTKAILELLEEFNDDQIVLRIEAEKALNVKLPVRHRRRRTNKFSKQHLLESPEQRANGRRKQRHTTRPCDRNKASGGNPPCPDRRIVVI